MHAVGAVDQTLRRPFGQFRSPLGTGPLWPPELRIRFSCLPSCRVGWFLARCHLKNLSEIARCFQQTSPEPITHEINEIVQQPCTPHAGQMEFYLRWLAKHEQQPHEESPLGLILCSAKSQERIELMELGKFQHSGGGVP